MAQLKKIIISIFLLPSFLFFLSFQIYIIFLLRIQILTLIIQ